MQDGGWYSIYFHPLPTMIGGQKKTARLSGAGSACKEVLRLRRTAYARQNRAVKGLVSASGCPYRASRGPLGGGLFFSSTYLSSLNIQCFSSLSLF